METQTVAGTIETATHIREARRGLLVFGSVLLPLSFVGYWMYATNSSTLPLRDLPLMLSPALAAAVTRMVLREGLWDGSFRFGGRRSLRAIVLGLAVPLLVGSLAYSSAYLAGLAMFVPQALPIGTSWAGPLGSLALWVALNATFGTLILLLPVAGEEIGWRGELLPRLIAAGVPQPLLVSGLIWGGWHLVPLVTSGYAAGPSLLFSAIGLMIAATAFGFILGWLRLDTGSIWPPVVAHAAWNAIINGGFGLATQGEDSKQWVGESGVLVALALVGMTVAIGCLRGREASQSGS